MKYEIKKLEKSAVEVKLFLDKEELSPILDKIVKKATESTELPGFRKGKAPKEAVIAAHKEHIDEEVANEVINTYFGEVVDKEKINPISYVRMKNTNISDACELTFDIDVYPEVELGEYKGIAAEKKEVNITDEIVNNVVEDLLLGSAKLEDVADEAHKAELGDTVDLAFEGFIDGVPFDGGKAESHLLELGSKSFIDTFEEQLVGYVKGQEGEINVKFPEEYHSKELAGKPAVFKVKINAIKKLNKPELNDEFAKTLNYESVEDLKAKKRAELEAREKDMLHNEYVLALLEKIAENTKVDIPEAMVQSEINARINDMAYQLSAQGLKIDDYLKMMGGSIETLAAQIRPMAEKKVKHDLILNKIAELEKIEISDEDMAKRWEEVAARYGLDVEKMEAELVKNNNLENFRATVRIDEIVKRAIDVIVNNAK